jgi:hypothetical protein
MKLYDNKTGKEFKAGDKIICFRGEEYVITSFQPPKHSGSTGRVYVKPEGADGDRYSQGYYPSVFDAEYK